MIGNTREFTLTVYLTAILLIVSITSDPALADNPFMDPLDHPAKQQPNPSSRPFLDIEFTGKNLVAVGPRGLIIVSTDMGQSWTQADVPVQTDLVSVTFPAHSSGWAIGHDGVILYSDDGGSTWSRQLDGRQAMETFVEYYEQHPDIEETVISDALELTQMNYRNGPALPYLDMWFANESTGFVVGTFGQFAATFDGGHSWQPWLHHIDNSMAAQNLNRIQKIDNSIYIASERGDIFRLSDLHRGFFERIETGYEGTFFGVTGNTRILLAYGLRGTIYRSHDKGETWDEIAIPTQATINHGIALADEQGFIFVTQNGELLLTDSTAERLHVARQELPMHVTSMTVTPNGNLLMAGFAGIRQQPLPEFPGEGSRKLN